MLMGASLVLFLSGASALLFETLWFRLAGLVFGNSVWASSLVLASFMGGLALGNGLAARRGARLTRPARGYALLEALIGTTGFGLVLLLPAMTEPLVPLFRLLLEQPLLLNGLRLGLAFALMLLPATAMGATLPVFVRALSGTPLAFGRVLGWLYGWNTLGAVAGALAGEALLIGALGIRGTALVAAGLNASAALGALWLGARLPAPETAPGAESADPVPAQRGGAARLLAAAALAGAILLALEVVWFRFLQLFVHGTNRSFAVLLAVVLLGISTGGLAAARWLRSQPDAARFCPQLALVAGWACIQSYLSFDRAPGFFGGALVVDDRSVAPLAAWLMLPVSFVSGLLFTLLGAALRHELGESARTTGSLTLANTSGAMFGALAGGFLLLPRLGIEGSFFVLAFAYGGVAWLARGGQRPRSALETWTLRAAIGVFAAFVALFPFGLMRNHYLPQVAERFPRDRVIATREGLTETVMYMQEDLWRQPRHYRLVTNGYSMAASKHLATRYMKLFGYVPLALNPEARSALVISYGLGRTVEALTEHRGLASIDVVDISADILELSPLAHRPGEDPLADPRARVHVEDGRFFLLATEQRFDVITGEPPPPKNAGIVNLYTQEYFELVYTRLAPGGVASYWLPVMQLQPQETGAVVRAFCAGFEDCSLWTGTGYEWMLVGTRGAAAPEAEAVRALWQDPVLGAGLAEIGIETPGQLGALRIGGPAFLEQATRGIRALVDNFPQRLSPDRRAPALEPYTRLMDPRAARLRFEADPPALWPAELGAETLEMFEFHAMLTDFLFYRSSQGPWRGLPERHRILTGSPLETLLYLFEDSSPREARLAEATRGVAPGDPYRPFVLGLSALGRRDYAAAARLFAEAQQGGMLAERVLPHRVLSLCLSGERAAAAALAWQSPRIVEAAAGSWEWLEATCGIAAPERRGTPQG